MRSMIVIAAVSILFAASAIAAAPKLVGENRNFCPEGRTTVLASAIAEVESTPPAAAPSTRLSGAGGEAASAPQRVRPRWQVYLPGMFK